MEGERSSWDEIDDQPEVDDLSGEDIYRIGSQTVVFANQVLNTENHSAVESSLGLIREIRDPLSRLSALNALGQELEEERARIINEL